MDFIQTFGRVLTPTRILETLAYTKHLILARYDTGYASNLMEYAIYRDLIKPFRIQQESFFNPFDLFNNWLESKMTATLQLSKESVTKQQFLDLIFAIK